MTDVRPEIVPPGATGQTLVICTVARSGSNLLCNYLTNTRLVGEVGEILNPDVIRRGFQGRQFGVKTSVSMAQYLRWARGEFASPSNVFGLKILHEDFGHLGHFTGVAELLKGACIVFLRRRSKVKQAISYYLAEQTGKWVSSDAGTRNEAEVAFDFERIDAYIKRLTQQEMHWIRWLETLELDYFELWHEDFVLDPAGHMRKIFAEMGLTVGDFPVVSTLENQSTRVNREFYAEFIRQSALALGEAGKAASYKGLTFAP